MVLVQQRPNANPNRVVSDDLEARNLKDLNLTEPI